MPLVISWASALPSAASFAVNVPLMVCAAWSNSVMITVPVLPDIPVCCCVKVSPFLLPS